MKLRLILPDSSFFILALRLKQLPFTLLEEQFGSYEIVTCEMVMLEVLCGIRVPRMLQYITSQFEALRCLDMRKSTWRLARHLAWERERAGRRLGTPDIIIAACAIESGAAVLTRDKRFSEIPNLHVVSSF